MNDSKKRLTESISALVDGEVSELELHRILRDLDNDSCTDEVLLDDQGSRGKWSRYNLISDALSETNIGCTDISVAVSRAIESEDSHSLQSQAFRLKKFSVNSMGRFAVAASVAMLAILGVQQLNNVDPVQNNNFHLVEMDIEQSEQVRGPAIQFPAGFQPMVEARTVNAGGSVKTSQHPVTLVKTAKPNIDLARDPQLRAFLSEILEAHATNESENGIQGMLPYARHLDTGEDIGTE
jgi:sigma-E factor negative regulatory protein RseA